MSGSRFRCVMLLLFVVVAAGIPRDAVAQVKRLKKAVENKAADQAVEAAVANRPPTKVKNITLTSAQIRQLNKGLRAELATAAVAQKEYEQQQKKYEQDTKAYEKSMADYDKTNGAYNRCRDKFSEADQAKSDELRGKAEKSGQAAGKTEDELATLEAKAARAAAAAERVANGTGTAEDRAILAEFQGIGKELSSQGARAGADMQASSEYDQGAQARLEKACGKEPQAPTAPTSPGNSPGEVVRQAGADAAGVPQYQYAVWRDEGTAYAESNTEVEPSDGAGGGGGNNKDPNDKDPKDKSSNSGDSGGASGGGVSAEEAKAINEGIQETRVILAEMKKANIPI